MASIAWQIFIEASEIFLRLLRGDTIQSNDIRETILTRENFRSDEDWIAVQNALEEVPKKFTLIGDISSKRYRLFLKNGQESNWN